MKILFGTLLIAMSSLSVFAESKVPSIEVKVVTSEGQEVTDLAVRGIVAGTGKFVRPGAQTSRGGYLASHEDVIYHYDNVKQAYVIDNSEETVPTKIQWVRVNVNNSDDPHRVMGHAAAAVDMTLEELNKAHGQIKVVLPKMPSVEGTVKRVVIQAGCLSPEGCQPWPLYSIEADGKVIQINQNFWGFFANEYKTAITGFGVNGKLLSQSDLELRDRAAESGQKVRVYYFPYPMDNTIGPEKNLELMAVGIEEL